MAQCHTDNDRDEPSDLDQAAERLRERHPYGVIDQYYTTQTVAVTISMSDVEKKGTPCVAVSSFDAPEGWEFDSVSLHPDTDSMYVTFQPEEDL
jgi:hypothetical protein